MNQKHRHSNIIRLFVVLVLLIVMGGLRPQASATASNLNLLPLNTYPNLIDPDAIETLNFTTIAAGQYHTCALTASGGVKCWGSNGAGQLGDGTTVDRNTPVDVFGLTSGVKSISTGLNHTCALTTSGGMKCWGNNSYGQLGDDTLNGSSLPVDVFGLTTGVTGISAGGWHTCATTSGSEVKCWGYNGYGQLGDSTWTDSKTPVNVVGLTGNVLDIFAGGFHTCVLLDGGGMKCWGNNWYGQLGDSSTSHRNTPVDVVGLANSVTAITAGAYHTCALITGDGMQCWGENGKGQLGDGTTDQRHTPVDVVGLTSAVTGITAGWSHTCALSISGGMMCWGNNDRGQIGDGTLIQRSYPVDVVGLTSGVIFIAAGDYHTCALVTGNVMKCWGHDGYAQLGDGVITQRSTPMDVIGLPNSIAFAKAGPGNTCSVDTDGGMMCWGDNVHGQLGDGTTTSSSTPVKVFGMSDVKAITLGSAHTCALTAANGVKCWGGNWLGQLGNGTWSDAYTPVDVVGLTSGVTAIAAGLYHTCALTDSGGVKCWGLNAYGQLGDGSTTGSNFPVDVTGLTSNVAAISAGRYHTCALTLDRGLKCWGNNASGQLGDGTLDQRTTPVDVFELTNGVIASAAGALHTCALIDGGGMKCWGDNGWGQLGDGTNDQHSTPVDVIGLSSPVTDISLGNYHTCALTAIDGLLCWGYNAQGQLGNGTTLPLSTPEVVDGMASSVTAIAAGGWHNCALVGEGRLKCWGWDTSGQLGIGTFIMRLLPVNVIETLAPIVNINYPTGQPGSFFTITGWNFPPDTQATLSINGEVIAPDLAINPSGGFIFFLDTTGCEPGGYTVLVSVNPSGITGFILDGGANFRFQEGGGKKFFLPPGIGYHNFVFLPVLKK